MPSAAPDPDTHGVDTHGIAPDVYRRRWLILAILNLSLVMIVMAVTHLNVALPTLQRDLAASGTELQWIVDAYALVFAGLLLTAGALGDRFGRKGALQVGLVIFGAAVAARQASARPAHRPRASWASERRSSCRRPCRSSPTCSRPRSGPEAIAIWAAFAGVGGALGPVTSGLLLEHFWWGSVFMVDAADRGRTALAHRARSCRPRRDRVALRSTRSEAFSPSWRSSVSCSR